MAKNKAAVELGRRGGKARNPRKGFGSLSPEDRKEAASKAARARWAKEKGGPKAAPYDPKR